LTNALMTTMSYNEIAQLTGVYVGGSTVLPSLKLNRDAVTENGNKVPQGSYMVTQDGVNVYAKTALFRPFINSFQYMQFDNTAGKFSNKSIIVKSFREQAIDELGGVKCGRIDPKEFQIRKERNLVSLEEQDRQKSIKCYRNLYGTVTMEKAVTESGEETSVIDLPVLWRTAGVNFNAANNALKAIEKKKHYIFQHQLLLGEPKREKKGSNVYYVVTAEPILTEEVPFTQDVDAQIFQTFQEIIDRENKYVAEKWRSLTEKNKPFDTSAMSALELDDPLDDLLMI